MEHTLQQEEKAFQFNLFDLGAMNNNLLFYEKKQLYFSGYKSVKHKKEIEWVHS